MLSSTSMTSSYAKALLAVASAKSDAAGDMSAVMKAAIEQAQATGESVAAEQTLADYKSAFLARIDTIPIHSSQVGARQSISIPDALFEKMLADPELAGQVFSQIEADLTADFVVPPAFTTMRFDENGVYSGSAGGSAHMSAFERESADAIWRREPVSELEKNAKKRAEAAEKDEKEKKRKELAELLVTLAVQRRDNERAMHESRGEVAKGIADYVVGTGSVVRPSVLESFV